MVGLVNITVWGAVSFILGIIQSFEFAYRSEEGYNIILLYIKHTVRLCNVDT